MDVEMWVTKPTCRRCAKKSLPGLLISPLAAAAALPGDLSESNRPKNACAEDHACTTGNASLSSTGLHGAARRTEPHSRKGHHSLAKWRVRMPAVVKCHFYMVPWPEGGTSPHNTSHASATGLPDPSCDFARHGSGCHAPLSSRHARTSNSFAAMRT